MESKSRGSGTSPTVHEICLKYPPRALSANELMKHLTGVELRRFSILVAFVRTSSETKYTV